MQSLVNQLQAFKLNHRIVNIGALCTVLVVTNKAKHLQFPIGEKNLLSKGGGQVAGLSGAAANRILRSHNITQEVGTESGRTSRGTPAIAREWADLLNGLYAEGLLDLAFIESWWVKRVVDYFNSEPFKISYDDGKTLISALQGVISQAIERQKKSPGKTYVGTVLQHLVGAKLSIALPEIEIAHHGASVADSISARSGDFVLDDVIIHCTTSPSPELLKKCSANLRAGKRPIVLTVSKAIGAAELEAEKIGIDGRVEVMDAIQFVAANLYELSLFRAAERRVALDALVQKYNVIIDSYESDASLRIELG